MRSGESPSSWPEKVYRLLLRSYPGEFRRCYGDEMLQTFRSSLRDQPSSVEFWRIVLQDWCKSVTRERLSVVKGSAVGLIVAALLIGFFASCVDFGNDEVQPSVLVVLLGCFLLASIQPRFAWKWALIVALCLPVGRWLGPRFGYEPKLPATPNNFATLIALIPALIGSYSGVALRAVARLITR